MGFQRQVNSTPAPAVAGDFASANPRASVLAGPGGLVAGAGGVIVGRFAWIAADGITVHSYGTAPHAPDGFVHREQQALITTYLGEASNVIPEGFPVTLHNAGDFFVNNAGPAASAMNQSVYATYSNGAATFGSAATGASVTGSIGGSVTASIGSTFTATSTGTSLAVTSLTGFLSVGDKIGGTGVPADTTIVAQVSGTAGAAGTYTTSGATTCVADTVTSFGDVLKVATIGAGTLQPGDAISGTGVPAGAKIVAQLTGATGSTGNYSIDTAATAYAASTTVTSLSTVLVVSAVGSGVVNVGDPISGTNVTSGTVIAGLGTGTGGVGTYTLNLASTASSTTITIVNGVVTGWKAKSVASVGELVKISTWG